VLEENSNNHAVRRALAHAETVHALARMADRVPVVCAANALQPDRQNDNGWDQGFLFLDQSKVWAQPPLFVTQMISTNRLPRRLDVETKGAATSLDVLALGGDGAACLFVVNTGSERVRTRIKFEGLPSSVAEVTVTQLRGGPDETNEAADPERVVPWRRTARVEGDAVEISFPPGSYSVIRPVGTGTSR
jgi:alpha-L-arabinofuranosidase